MGKTVPCQCFSLHSHEVVFSRFLVLQQKALMPPGMAFVGGTCLRLCCGSNRYSEDIDFHAGVGFQPENFDSAIDRLLVDLFMRFHKKRPKKIILDIDITDDPLHAIIEFTYKIRRKKYIGRW